MNYVVFVVILDCVFFFFFKQKTAYEVRLSLVGSEMGLNKNKINRVPTMLTKNGKILVGNEIKNWLDSLLPKKDVDHAGIGGMGCSMTSLDGDTSTSEMFRLDDYGQSLQPAMTPELQEKIGRDVSKGVAYSDLKM